MLAAGIVGGISGLAQLGMGIADKVKAAKKQREAKSFWEKNKYTIPESAKAQLKLAERDAAGLRLPGQDIMEENIRTSTAQGVQEAKSAAMTGGDVLGMLGSVYGNQQNQFKQLGLSAAQDFQQRQQFLGSVLSGMAGFERERWEENSKNQYYRMLGEAETYGNRGADQITSGVGTLMGTAGTLMQGAQASRELASLEKYYGLGGGTSQSPALPGPQGQMYPPQRVQLNPGQMPSYGDYQKRLQFEADQRKRYGDI